MKLSDRGVSYVLTSSPPASEKSADQRKINDAFDAYLSRLGLRQTKQRRVIVEAVLTAGPHVDAETIMNQARQIDKSVGLATVYRTLQLMTAAGILLEHSFGKERSTFEFVTPDTEHHDHLICNQCGSIVEFYDDAIENLQLEVAKKLGFKLKTHRMELFADCLKPETCVRRKSLRGL
jgi:Fur family ferric uptake transcriptional regulator